MRLSPDMRVKDREALDLNVDLLEPLIEHMGTRVAVDVLEVHIRALYGLMKIGLNGYLLHLIVQLAVW